MTVLRFRISGIGLVGPGLASWATGRALLGDPSGWLHVQTAVPAPSRLPPTERRRAGPEVKLALAVADEAVAAWGGEVGALPTVFTSSTGEPGNCHALCEALAAPERLVSPTRFTNSVHNAAAGYWHIAAQARAASTSLGAFDASFGAGLLEAASQCALTKAPVLLVACDVPYPEPLLSKRPVADAFGVAMVLAPAAASHDGGDATAASQAPGAAATEGRAALHLTLAGDATPSPCANAGFEALRRTIPAARALPLLELLAAGRAGSVVIEGVSGAALRLDVGVDEGGPA